MVNFIKGSGDDFPILGPSDRRLYLDLHLNRIPDDCIPVGSVARHGKQTAEDEVQHGFKLASVC